MNKQTFRQAAGLSEELANRWFELVVAAMDEFDINTPARQAAFIAQIRHESGGFRQLVESFNYKPSALAIFSRVPAQQREMLGRRLAEAEVPLVRQQQIANLAYGGRYGNGDPASGDGWRYRGRGLKQITFRDNYAACGKALGSDLLSAPDLLASADNLAARSAGWFWKTNGCNGPADRGDFAGTTRIINGPAMDGQEKRVAFWNDARSALRLA
ncbi:glycoside hydrolase family 19 protein [Paraburkholderia silviterrae]|uniref:Glycoside hydrolase family 19 protein n=1 Tax=Paraburkholderia silviterrae TaxID=2528715 RepID=A0A4R5M5A2_9BURK|nr:glycoside hydrolase family 19 protein [Paraburkholderia silviterrae]TDG21122.1 glycoside hydrolase family 19 protein [Paraburkholderia silviterrae]